MNRAPLLWILALGVGAAGCGGDDPSTGGPSPLPGASAAPARASSPVAAPVPQPPRPLAANPNPLGLPPRELDLPAGARVFAVPEPMLHGARLGSSFVLHAARVVGRDGDGLLVQTREGEPYKLHPGYVVAVPPGEGRARVGEPVLAEWAGVMKHGVLRSWKKDTAVVRFFDASDTRDRSLADAIVIPAKDGFRPGNFAAARVAGDLRHVLLISPLDDAPGPAGAAGEAAPRRWLALGHAGAATLIEETSLLAVPVKWAPKEGGAVLAESLGRMRPAVVQAIDQPGLYTVKFERAGRGSTVGWGFLMPPAQPDGR